jgi:Tol biopolymer transport system component
VLAVGAGERPTRTIAEPQAAEHGKVILFTRNYIIWALNIDDGTVAQLTPEPVKRPILLDYPSWSPDGSKIVFESDPSPEGREGAKDVNIWVMNADGSKATAVTREPIPTHDWINPIWSPDGRKLAALTSWYEGHKHVVGIWSMNLDGSGGMPIMKASLGIGFDELTWSPDGKKLAFASNRALDGSDRPITNAPIPRNIWVINADGSAATPLTRFEQATGSPQHLAWSPDGRKLAFESNGALDSSDAVIRSTNIWIASADGSRAIPLTGNQRGREDDPAWSPDGSKLAFSSNGNIWVINADGSGAWPLTTLTAGVSSGSPAWSPDGKMIAYFSDRALDGSNTQAPDKCRPYRCSNLWMMQADGNDNRPLTRYENPPPPLKFRWRP